MKTIIATTFAIAIATTSYAGWDNNNGAKWNGSTGNLHTNGCQFDDQTNGTMVLDGPLWKTTSAASIKVQSRNINNIKVTSDNKLREGNTVIADVVVNYNGASGVPSSVNSNAQVNTNINNNEIAVGNANKPGAVITTITIGGTATMDVADLNDVDNNTQVSIAHSVTCLQ
jgi:hypothetical protein